MKSIFDLIHQLEDIHPNLYRNYDKQKFYEEAAIIKFSQKVN